MPLDFDAVLNRRGTDSLKWDAAGRFYGLDGVIPLWVADMDFPAPPAVVEAVKSRAAHPVYGYPLESKALWDPVVRWLAERQRWTIQREWLVRVPGVVPALNLCVHAFTRPGDGIIIQTPVYHPFYPAVERNGRRLIQNALRFDGRRFTMDLDDLARKADAGARMIILCSPHNPVGRVWTADELLAFGRLCAQRDLLVVSDEIHSDLIFRGHVQTPFAALGAELAGRTVTLQAPSKTFNTAGLSAAFAVVSDEKRRSLLKAQIENLGLTMGNVFGFQAMKAAYEGGREWLDGLLAYLEESLDFVEDFFRRRLPDMSFLRPEGTYLALVDARRLGLNPKALFRFFLEKARVQLDDGTKFGAALAGFLRMNVAAPRAVLREALERIEQALRER